ncbi:MAG: cobalt transporter CbiM [Clostridiaceae bacterium]|nr:cobalt transporter CbiM [Clostridiaceae bacterium]
MHIPDNYLSPSTCAAMGVAMLPVWAIAVKKVKAEVSKKRMPLLGIGSAFSFLIMMFNIPLPGGTTGHAVGGTLVAILLGPFSACICVTIALLIQALLFSDGGILAFGANCFNMAFVLPFTGYFVYKFIKSRVKSEGGDYKSAFIGSYIGINIGVLCAAIELGIQPLLFKDAAGMAIYCPFPLSVSVPYMLVPHLLVAGILEGIITAGVYSYIKNLSPELIYQGSTKKMKPLYGLIIAMILLTPLGLLAGGTAWGEWGTDEISSVVSGGKVLGFIPKAMEQGFKFNTLMPDYAFNGIPPILAYILSAIFGVAIVIILFKIITSIKKKNSELQQ